MKSAKQIVEHFAAQIDGIQREQLDVWSTLFAPLGLEVRDVVANLNDEGEIIFYCRFPSAGKRQSPDAGHRPEAVVTSAPERAAVVTAPVPVAAPAAPMPVATPRMTSESAQGAAPLWTPAPPPATVAPVAVAPAPPAAPVAPTPPPAYEATFPVMPMPLAMPPKPDLTAATAAAEQLLAEPAPAKTTISAMDEMFSNAGMDGLLDLVEPGMRTSVPSAPRAGHASPVMFPSLPLPEVPTAPAAAPPAMPPIRLPIPEPAAGPHSNNPMPSTAPVSQGTHVSSADIFEMPQTRLAEVQVTPATPAKHVNPFMVRTESPEAQAERAARAIISDIVAYDREGHQRVVAMGVGAIQEHFGHELDKAWRTFTTALGEKKIADDIHPGQIQRIFAEQVNEVLGVGQDVLALG